MRDGVKEDRKLTSLIAQEGEGGNRRRLSLTSRWLVAVT